MERNRFVGIALGGVVVIALAVIGISAVVSEPVSFDPDTPEGTVQTFVTAITEERWVDARSVLDRDLMARCDVADLSQVRGDDVSRVVIDDTTTTDDSAVVSVTITHTSTGNPLNPSSWDEDVTFVLASEDGAWVIDEMSWPYPPCRWETP